MGHVYSILPSDGVQKIVGSETNICSQAGCGNLKYVNNKKVCHHNHWYLFSSLPPFETLSICWHCAIKYWQTVAKLGSHHIIIKAFHIFRSLKLITSIHKMVKNNRYRGQDKKDTKQIIPRFLLFVIFLVKKYTGDQDSDHINYS